MLNNTNSWVEWQLKRAPGLFILR